MHKYTQGAGPDSKARRQRKISDIIRETAVPTQSLLAKELRRAGFPCTQASVSRDIAELGLVKKGGRYALADETVASPDLAEFAHSIKDFLKHAEIVGKNMVVVKTIPGTAQGVAEFLDKSNWAGLSGTVAGDNTIFVAVRDAGAAGRIVRNLKAVMRG